MNGIPSVAHSVPTPARVRIMPASVSPASAVKRTTASAPSRAASSTSAIWITWGCPPPRIPPRRLEQPAVMERRLDRERRFGDPDHPALIMMTLAPPAMVSAARVAMSASGSRKVGDVIPWSRAQMIETPAGSIAVSDAWTSRASSRPPSRTAAEDRNSKASAEETLV